MQVFKFLKNTYFFDIPLKNLAEDTKVYFINDDLGFGNQYEGSFKPFLNLPAEISIDQLYRVLCKGKIRTNILLSIKIQAMTRILL